MSCHFPPCKAWELAQGCSCDYGESGVTVSGSLLDLEGTKIITMLDSLGIRWNDTSWLKIRMNAAIIYWLVVWNILLFFHILGINNHPNWRTPSFFRGVGIPPTSFTSIYQCFWLWNGSSPRSHRTSSVPKRGGSPRHDSFNAREPKKTKTEKVSKN